MNHRTLNESFAENDLETLADFLESPRKAEVERVTGIEPVSEAWEAAVLPLNYTREPRECSKREATPASVRF